MDIADNYVYIWRTIHDISTRLGLLPDMITQMKPQNKNKNKTKQTTTTQKNPCAYYMTRSI